jgi:hypothetical protein
VNATAPGGTIFDRLNVRKDAVQQVVQLKGLSDVTPEVIFALDYSYSMIDRYKSGEVQETIERLLPLGMVLDRDQSMGFYTFDNRYKQYPNVTQNNINKYVEKNVKGDMGGTSYAPVIQAIAREAGFNEYQDAYTPPAGAKGFFGNLLSGNKPQEQERSPHMLDNPILVIMVTDGDNQDHAATEDLMRKISRFAMFVQFVGIGGAPLTFLEKLDNLKGTFIDNSNFFKYKEGTNDGQLYEQLLNEFPRWVKLAKQHNMIK